MKQLRLLCAALLVFCVVACSAREAGPSPPVEQSAAVAARDSVVVYEGDITGSGGGKFTYRAQSTGNPCTGTVYYIMGYIKIEVADNGELVKSYPGNEVPLYAKQFLACKLPAGIEFDFKPVGGTIDKDGKIDLTLETVDKDYATGSATLTGTLSDATLTSSDYTSSDFTLGPAKVHSIVLKECTSRCEP
jgi:hypothetical protein